MLMDLDYNYQRRIFFAAKDNELRVIKSIIEDIPQTTRGRLVDTLTEDTTPLIIAAKHRFMAVIHYLVESCNAGLEVTGSVQQDDNKFYGVTPLWCAVSFGHFDVVKYLIEKSANVNAVTTTNSTPLRSACFDGDLRTATHLLNNGAALEIPNRQQHTCLMIACYKGCKEVVELLLWMGANVHTKDCLGQTALHNCAEGGNLEIVKLLLKRNAKLEQDSFGETPLLVAASKGHIHIVQHFLSLGRSVDGSDCEIPNHRGYSCLVAACENGHDEVAKTLIEQYDVDINRRCADGRTALLCCAEGGYITTVQLLLSHGAQMYSNNFGDTPLMRAAFQGHTDVVEFFLSAKSEVVISLEEKIDALELLGAAFAIQQKDYEKAAHYWQLALVERLTNGFDKTKMQTTTIRETTPSQMAVYGGATELTTSEKLKASVTDEWAMQIQGLLKAERILRCSHPKTNSWIQRIAYNNSAESIPSEKDIVFTVYTLENSLKAPFNLLVSCDLRNADLILQMFIQKSCTDKINFLEFIRIFEIAIKMCEKATMVMKRKSMKVWGSSNDSRRLTEIITAIMHFISTGSRIASRLSEAQMARFQTEIRKFLQLDPRGKNGQTPLHYAVTLDEVRESYSMVRFFPCLTTLDTLLGHNLTDVNAVDNDGNTALHLASQHAGLKPNLPARPEPEITFLRKLLAAGADMKILNKCGHAAFKRFQNSCRLQCLLTPPKHLAVKFYDDRVVSMIDYDFNVHISEILARIIEKKIC